MKHKSISVICCLTLFSFAALAQTTLSPVPTFALGQPADVPAFEIPKHCDSTVGSLGVCRPNMVLGFELNGPQSVAVDPTSGAVYVADSGNNRVLGWRTSVGLLNGATADLVIGQRDLLSTNIGGPSSSDPALKQSGLRQPTALAVDANGNLFVGDAGNNRIVRYRAPFSQPEGLKLANMAIGQPSLSTNGPNNGGLSATSIDTTATGSSVYRTSLTFDAGGNLWFTDAGNNRVLRYPASALGESASSGPAADRVLGQDSFTTNAALARNVNNRFNKTGMRIPSALAFDASGHLFVADELNRVIVFDSPIAGNGQDAVRVMGLVVVVQGENPPPPVNERSLGIVDSGGNWSPPEGLFCIGDVPFVVDTPTHRILRYAPYDQWPVETQEVLSPAAVAVIGQDALTSESVLVHRGRAEPAADTLLFPVGATVGPNNTIFVADSGNNRVLIYPDLSTGPASSVGAPYAATTVIGQPDMPNRSINEIDGREFFFTGALASHLVSGKLQQGLVSAADIAVDWNSDPPHMYVADTNNNRVLGFADARSVRNGTRADIVIGQPGMFRSLANFPSSQPSATGLYLPVGLAVDSAGNLFVADWGNSRVLRFPKPFAQPAGTQTADLVLGQESFAAHQTDPTARTMAAPWGLRLGIEGRLLVSDTSHNRILQFNPPFQSGMSAARVIGQPDFFSTATGTALNRLNNPRGMSTDTSNRLFVADSGNNRVLIFGDIRLAPLDPTASLALTGLRTPQDVDVSPSTGKSWVANTGGTQNQLLLYPQFDQMLLPSPGPNPEAGMASGGPLAVASDPAGSLYVADVLNRVVGLFPLGYPLNGANYLARSAPGLITSLFFDDDPSIELKSATSLPLPTVLADVSVFVDDVAVPLYFVSSNQINFQMPNNAPASGLVQIIVTRVSTQQIIASRVVQMSVASPGLFTIPAVGTGQIAALNQDNSVNTTQNPAKVGEIVQLFATGAGNIPGAPPDGKPTVGLIKHPGPAAGRHRVGPGGSEILRTRAEPGRSLADQRRRPRADRRRQRTCCRDHARAGKRRSGQSERDLHDDRGQAVGVRFVNAWGRRFCLPRVFSGNLPAARSIAAFDRASRITLPAKALTPYPADTTADGAAAPQSKDNKITRGYRPRPVRGGGSVRR